MRPLKAGSAGIPARHERRRREDEETLYLDVGMKREAVSVLAHASGQGCPRSQGKGE
jgi:hypothetical protein